MRNGAYRVMGTLCAVHTHREMVPIEHHHVWPLGDGGPNTRQNIIEVCANGHSSTHYLLDHIRRAGSLRGVPWSIRRRFGRRVRRFAELGWDRIQRQAM